MRSFAAAALIAPPFPARLHPHAAEAGDRSARWAAELGLIVTAKAAQRLDRANASELAGRACPDAEPDRLNLLTDLVTWLFAFDDSCDDDGLGADPSRLSPVVGRLLDVLDRLGDTPPKAVLTAAGPMGVGLHDLCRRLRERNHLDLLVRFVAQFRDYLLALLWEAANRVHHRVPAIAEYIQMRRLTGAVHPSFTLTDHARDARPGPAALADTRLSALDRLAADLVCWCNDVFSYGKERQLEHDGHNLTLVIARETGRDEQTALSDAAGRFNAGLEAYLRLEGVVLDGAEPAVTRFVAGRRAWIRATYDWSLHATRYA